VVDKKINFFTVATGKYKDFIVPYVTSVLHHNRDAFVEILVDNIAVLAQDIASLNKLFGGEYKIIQIGADDIARVSRSGTKWSSMAASLRFVTMPTVKLEYTYIGDIDILVLQKDIWPLHANYMKLTGVPYSNMARRGQKRLTGLHCVRTGAYYKVLNQDRMNFYRASFLTRSSKLLDEHLLYKMVSDTFGIPGIIVEGAGNKYLFRPYHGVHCSPQYKSWYVGNYRKEFFGFVASETVKSSFFPYYKNWYLNKLYATHKVYVDLGMT
jgi:hypothetical protein